MSIEQEWVPVDWVNENNWWCPPVHLVCRILQQATPYHNRGTLIDPAWRSAPFFLASNFPRHSCLCSLILDVRVLVGHSDLIIAGESGSKLPVEHGYV